MFFRLAHMVAVEGAPYAKRHLATRADRPSTKSLRISDEGGVPGG